MAYDIIIGRDEADKKKFGKEGLILLGKSYVKMGNTLSLSNNIYLDIARAHVILVSGKRGSGKCLLGDTLIPLNDGSLVPIETLENNACNVMSLNEKLKIEEAIRSEFFSREVERIIKLKLRSGREIKLTPEHPLLTIKGWKAAEELNLGSRIATPRKVDCFGKESLEHYKIKLLAYLIAEGHFKKGVLFSNSDQELIDEFENSLKLFDSKLSLVKDKKDHYRVVEKGFKNEILNIDKIRRNKKGQFDVSKLNHKKRSIRLFLEGLNLWSKGSLERFIPQEIFRLNKNDLALFLNRLFSCDGSIYKSRKGNKYLWEISYGSSSKRLIHDVFHLLLRFGIISKIRDKNIKYNGKMFKSYEIVIGTINIKTFIEEIGFFGVKKIRQENCLKEVECMNRNPNVDTIPKELWEIYRPDNWADIGRFCGYAYPKAMRERIKYCPSRETLMMIGRAKQDNGLINLAQSDIFWDEIICMEILEGRFKVYDICVPEIHNFVANDIIVHNSYSLGVIGEGISNLPQDIKNNLSVLFFDTMGVFWTMKYANEKDSDLLEQWGMRGEGLDVDIYTPRGYFDKYKEEGVLTDYSFAIQPRELTVLDWCKTFGINPYDEIGILIADSLEQLNIESNYSIDEIINVIRRNESAEWHVKNSAEDMFQAAKTWGLFSKEGTRIKDIIKAGRVSILDLSCYSTTSGGGWNIKSLVVGIICNKLLMDRIVSRKKEEVDIIERGYSYFRKESEIVGEKMPLVWIVIDEAHEFLGRDDRTMATDALIALLREGRQPGISLILATQQPGKVHDDVLTQADIVLSHRVTAKRDIDALNEMMQSYMEKGLVDAMNDLPDEKGSAVILDDTSERLYSLRVRPRITWHGGESPTAVHRIERLELGF